MVFNFGVPIYFFLSLESIKLNFLVVPAQNASVILYAHFKRLSGLPQTWEKWQAVQALLTQVLGVCKNWESKITSNQAFFAVINRALYIVLFFCDSSIAVIMRKLDIPVWSPVCGIFITSTL